MHVNSALETDDDMNNAIMAIRRNGVALKGKRQTLKQFVEIHQVEMWLCKKTETVQLYVTL